MIQAKGSAQAAKCSIGKTRPDKKTLGAEANTSPAAYRLVFIQSVRNTAKLVKENVKAKTAAIVERGLTSVGIVNRCNPIDSIKKAQKREITQKPKKTGKKVRVFCIASEKKAGGCAEESQPPKAMPTPKSITAWTITIATMGTV